MFVLLAPHPPSPSPTPGRRGEKWVLKSPRPWWLRSVPQGERGLRGERMNCQNNLILGLLGNAGHVTDMPCFMFAYW